MYSTTDLKFVSYGFYELKYNSNRNSQYCTVLSIYNTILQSIFGSKFSPNANIWLEFQKFIRNKSLKAKIFLKYWGKRKIFLKNWGCDLFYAQFLWMIQSRTTFFFFIPVWSENLKRSKNQFCYPSFSFFSIKWKFLIFFRFFCTENWNFWFFFYFCGI